MKQRLFHFVVLLLTSQLCFGQSQQGYVKTKGRLATNGTVVHGTRLSGTMITVRGHNSVLSGSNGSFTLAISGNNYCLQNVQKQGYVLTDPDILTRQYSYSKNPLVLVLESQDQQMDDKLQIERKIRRNLQRRILQREEEIEKLKEENKLTKKEYQEQLKKLYADEDKDQQLINDMVERYLRIDFDELDEFNRRISQFILHGRLTEADSLISTKGDIAVRANTFRQHQKANAQEELQLKKRQKQLEKSKMAEQQELNDLAQDCYSKFEIFILQHKNDSAAFYLELRASLDTTNVQWKKEVGDFMFGYIADFRKALSYYESALKYALLQDEEYNNETMLFYANVGKTYAVLGDVGKAIDSFEKAKDIARGIDSQLYIQMIDEIEKELNVKVDDINELPQKLQQAIIQKKDEKSYLYLSDSYNRIAALFSLAGDYLSGENKLNYYEDALDYYEDVLEFREKILDVNHPDIAESCVNMGIIHSKQFNFHEALKYYERALEIVKNIDGEIHPWMVAIYNNMGQVYAEQRNYSEALVCFEKSLNIRENESKTDRFDLVDIYHNIGIMCGKLGKYSEAITYFKKAQKIIENVLGKSHPHIGNLYESIGYVYNEQGELEKAVSYYQKGLDVYEKVYGKINSIVANSYRKLSDVYSKQGDYGKALDNYLKALEIDEKIYDEKDFHMAKSYSAVGDIYLKLENDEKAMEYYHKTLRIVEIINGENYSYVTKSDDKDGEIYFHVKSNEYLVLIDMIKRLKITPNIVTCYYNIGEVHDKRGDYAKALEYFQKALTIQQTVLGENHPNVQKTREIIDDVKLKIK